MGKYFPVSIIKDLSPQPTGTSLQPEFPQELIYHSTRMCQFSACWVALNLFVVESTFQRKYKELKNIIMDSSLMQFGTKWWDKHVQLWTV